MNENQFAEAIEDVLLSASDDSDSDLANCRVSTYNQVGLLTLNEGLIVRVGNDEFQVTIVKSA